MKSLPFHLAIAVLCVLIISTSAFAATQAPPKTPDLPGASMWVPWSDFKEILEKLQGAAPVEPPAPPVDAVISGAEYFAQVGENGVTVHIAAKVVVLKEKGWTVLPLMRNGVPISGAQLDGKPTALVDKGDGRLSLVLQGAGNHTLDLFLGLPLTDSSGPKQFSLPTLKAQVNLLEVEINQPDQKVNISTSGYMESKTVGSKTVARGSFYSGDSLTVSWTRTVPKSMKETARISAEVRTMLTVGEGLGVFTSIVDYDIQHKPITEFTLSLPPDVSVADVSTEGLVDWNVEKTPDAQTLNVSISFEAVGRHQVAVTYEKAMSDGEESAFAVALLQVKNVVHEVGYLAVAVRTNVQVLPKEGSQKNLATIDSSELPSDLRGSGDQKVLFGYKYIKHPSQVTLDVVRHKDASVLTCEVEQASYKMMVTDRGKQLLEATYKIANRSMQYLTLTLPEGMDLWGVYRDGSPVKAAEQDGKILLPIFKAGLRESFTMKVLAYRKSSSFLPAGIRNLQLPQLDVGINKEFLELYLPGEYRAFGFGGKLRPTGQAPTSTAYLKVDKSGPDGGLVGNDNKDFDRTVVESDERMNWNIKYRNENSQVQSQVVNIPVSATNAGYSSAMTRGALAVEFNVSWEGRPYRFATSIVDPGEKTSVRFFYTQRSTCKGLYLLVILIAGYIGYLVTRAIVAKKSEDVAMPVKKDAVRACVVVVIGALLTVVRGVSTGAIVFGACIGALLVLVPLAAKKIKTRPKKPARAPRPPIAKPIQTPMEKPEMNKPEPKTPDANPQAKEEGDES